MGKAIISDMLWKKIQQSVIHSLDMRTQGVIRVEELVSCRRWSPSPWWDNFRQPDWPCVFTHLDFFWSTHTCATTL